MRALYLYFAETAHTSTDPSSPNAESRLADDGPLVPIQPGAFARWMANRDRVVAENAAALQSAVTDSPLRRRPEATG
jgi:cytochrome c1